MAFAAGLRGSELASLRIDQVDRQIVAGIHVMAKGRRERVLPLWTETSATLKAWLAVRSAGSDAELFLNAAGRAMTRSGFEYILTKHVDTAFCLRARPLAANESAAMAMKRNCSAPRLMFLTFAAAPPPVPCHVARSSVSLVPVTHTGKQQ
ncbi:Mobile element protein (plasmid) [Sinorhizobium fredii CCBAU 25509]|nr:Mobile element protein [Sinorhizobium fredii CCBAU 25509]